MNLFILFSENTQGRLKPFFDQKMLLEIKKSKERSQLLGKNFGIVFCAKDV